MAHLITPIEIDGFEMCCNPQTRRTEALVRDAASEAGPDQWEIFHATAWGDPESNEEAESTAVVTGSVKFGVCCASTVTIELTGKIETLNTGYDWIRVSLNGEQKFYHESTETSDEPWETVSAGPFNVTLSLEDRPCGNIILIEGSTGDAIANNDVWWRARVTSIS